MNTTTHKNATA